MVFSLLIYMGLLVFVKEFLGIGWGDTRGGIVVPEPRHAPTLGYATLPTPAMSPCPAMRPATEISSSSASQCRPIGLRITAARWVGWHWGSLRGIFMCGNGGMVREITHPTTCCFSRFDHTRQLLLSVPIIWCFPCSWCNNCKWSYVKVDPFPPVWKVIRQKLRRRNRIRTNKQKETCRKS